MKELQAADARDAYAGANPEYLEIQDKRLLTVLVTNRNSAKPRHQGHHATIIDQGSSCTTM
jgi:hypothetical protein